MAVREAGPSFPGPPGAPARSSFSGALNLPRTPYSQIRNGERVRNPGPGGRSFGIWKKPGPFLGMVVVWPLN